MRFLSSCRTRPGVHPNQPIISTIVGALTLLIILLVIGREIAPLLPMDLALATPLLLLLGLLTLNVNNSRRAFVLVAAALTLGNLLWHPDWRATLQSGLVTAAFITAFFSALTTLKYVAETSPAIRNCGRFLSAQPPGRRYLALTVGGQLFGLLLNYGSISLLGGMSLANASLEPNEEIRRHRVRRMLLAIQRGFISILPWSPFSFAIAISTTLVPGASWVQVALPGFISGSLLAATGWALDSLFKPKLSSPLPARGKVEGNWLAITPLLLLLALLALLLGGGYWLTGLRMLVLVMIIVPLLSFVWVAIQANGERPLRQAGQRSREYITQRVFEFRAEMVLLMMAGYIGTVASPLLGSAMAALHIDLTALPAWLILVLIVWLIPLAGQLGMNPILAAAIIAPLLPEASLLGVAPAAVVLAITAGWILSGVSSPFTVTTLLVGHFAGVSASHVGQRWNGVYTILCGVILSLWVVSYAYWL
jgi:hypothetical protein